MKPTARMEQNAQKFVYLIKAYPEKNITEVISLFQMGPIDINTAIWLAMERKYIGEVDEETKRAPVLKEPRTWDFGEEETELENALTYAFHKLNEQEKDMEENYLSNWVAGYSAQDSLIAVKRLLEKGVLHEYQLEDGENKYIFYTLKENEGKNWGTKQFKVDPMTGEPNEVEAPDAPETTE